MRIQIMQGINMIFYVVVLIMSVVIHEMAHGFAAESQGDPTARYAGRLTLNPLKHIDPIGSILVPLLVILSSSTLLIGWAKPVPYVEANLRNRRMGTIIVAGAGIVANLGLALIFGMLIRFSSIFGGFAPAFISIAAIITWINLLLAFFNLVPIAPLDGSKILFSLLPVRSQRAALMIEYISLPILLVFIIFLWPHISPLISTIFGYITGTPLPLS